MQPVICYVYEYDRDRRIRNAGFLKIQPKDPGVLLYFHIRSPLFRAQTPWKIYAFRSDGASCTLYPLLDVSVENLNFRMQLSLDSLQLTDQLALDDMDGFWMSNSQNMMLAAAWKPTFVDSGRFSVYKDPSDCPEPDNAEPEDETPEEPSKNLPDEPLAELPENLPDEPPAELSENISDDIPDNESAEQANATTARTTEEPSETMPDEAPSVPSETTVIEAAETDEPLCASETCTEEPPKCTAERTPECASEYPPECAPECIPERASGSPATQPPSKNVRKICRKDLTLLPRRDWGLSNNSFLLHGCHNYHHLILAEEGHQLFLGVPGIYDQREARAAELFGFPLFSSEYVPFLDLTPEEKSENASFGHYLRKIRRN